VTDHGRHAVVPQSAGVNRRRHELVAQGVHLEQRCLRRSVTKIVAQLALGQGRAGGGFDGDDAAVFLLGDFLAYVWEDQPGEIAAAATTTEDHVRFFAGHFHLLDGFLTDDGLVEADVIEHAAQRILRVRVRDGVLDGFADGDAEAAGVVRVLGVQLAAIFGLVARAGVNRRAPGVHQHAAIGFLLVTDLDHVNGAFETEQFAGQRQ
jgi:hypothetical protein